MTGPWPVPSAPAAATRRGDRSPAAQADTATVLVGAEPFGVAITPNGDRAYVTNGVDKTVSVISIDSGFTGPLGSFGS